VAVAISISLHPLTQVFPGSSTLKFVMPSSSTALAQQTPSPSSPSNATVSNTTFVQNTNQASIISTAISLLSLIIALAVAYVSNFRKANIKFSLRRNIIIFSTPVNVSTGNSVAMSGVGFNLPVTFYNWSPQGGTIKRIRMVIGRHNSDDFHDMAWTTFVKIGSAGNFEDENLAQPISVEGQASVNKIIRFDWVPELSGKAFDVRVDNYEMRIYGWTRDTEKPDLDYKTSFTLKDEHYQQFKDSLAASLSLSIWIPLDENEKPNQLVSKNTVDRLYSN